MRGFNRARSTQNGVLLGCATTTRNAQRQFASEAPSWKNPPAVWLTTCDAHTNRLGTTKHMIAVASPLGTPYITSRSGLGARRGPTWPAGEHAAGQEGSRGECPAASERVIRASQYKLIPPKADTIAPSGGSRSEAKASGERSEPDHPCQRSDRPDGEAVARTQCVPGREARVPPSRTDVMAREPVSGTRPSGGRPRRTTTVGSREP